MSTQDLRASRTDNAVAAAVFVLAAVVHLAVRRGADLWGALGSDAPLWGLTAMNLRVGAPALVPPGYPALVAGLSLLGVPLVTAGEAMALIAAALLPAVVYRLVRATGQARTVALGAAALTLALPDAGAWAQQVQPDSLAALGLLAVAAALWAADAHHPRRLWLAALAAALLPLVREHGLVVFVVAAGVLLVRGRGRALAPLAVATTVLWLSPALLGQPVGAHPLALPWNERAGGALASLFSTDPDQVSYVRELHRADRAAYLALVQSGDLAGRLRWHLLRSLQLAWDGWLWLVLAGGLALRRRGAVLALASPLVAALPALLIWSQRRHVALLVPLAICVVLALLPIRRWSRGAVVAAMIALVLPWPNRWRSQVAAERTERARNEHLAEAGAWVCANAPRGSLLGGLFQDVGLYCPLPRHDPDGTPADWLTFLVADRPPGGTWERVHQGPGALSVYRREPDRSPRPCTGAQPAAHTPYLAVGRAHADIIGCQPDP